MSRLVECVPPLTADKALDQYSRNAEGLTMNVRADSDDIFGLIDGEPVRLFQLGLAPGITARILPLGGIVQSLEVPDAHGSRANVVLGYPSIEGYLSNSPYFGAIVGRYANRIAGGRFHLHDRLVELPLNNGANHLHGGPEGFSKRLWRLDPDRSRDHHVLSMTLVSDDGDQGYPGRLEARVTYSISDHHRFSIEYEATTDQPTVINLSQHSYFDLAGEGSGHALSQLLQINAGRYTPVSEHLTPTGYLESVEGTPFDFRLPKPIDRDIRADHPQLLFTRGFDHNFVIDRDDREPSALVEIAQLTDPVSRRRLTVLSTEPGVQFYSGNFLDGSETGTSGRAYRRGDGIALETQHFPDSPNHPDFPSAVLLPGDRYWSRTDWVFSWE